MLLLKYVVIALSSALWAFGLYDQFHSIESTATYVMLSVLMLAVAIF